MPSFFLSVVVVVVVVVVVMVPTMMRDDAQKDTQLERCPIVVEGIWS